MQKNWMTLAIENVYTNWSRWDLLSLSLSLSACLEFGGREHGTEFGLEIVSMHGG